MSRGKKEEEIYRTLKTKKEENFLKISYTGCLTESKPIPAELALK